MGLNSVSDYDEALLWLPGCRPGVVADENKGEGGIRTATYLFKVKYTTTA